VITKKGVSINETREFTVGHRNWVPLFGLPLRKLEVE